MSVSHYQFRATVSGLFELAVVFFRLLRKRAPVVALLLPMAILGEALLYYVQSWAVGGMLQGLVHLPSSDQLFGIPLAGVTLVGLVDRVCTRREDNP